MESIEVEASRFLTVATELVASNDSVSDFVHREMKRLFNVEKVHWKDINRDSDGARYLHFLRSMSHWLATGGIARGFTDLEKEAADRLRRLGVVPHQERFPQ